MQGLFVIIFIPLYLSAFDIITLDETTEGIQKAEEAKRKAKENSIAEDGKVIYKPMDKTILKPMDKTILKPIKKNIINPSLRNIIYPVGSVKTTTAPPKKDKKVTIKDDAFASKNELQTNIDTEAAKVEVDKFFDGLKETKGSDKINPVNIE